MIKINIATKYTKFKSIITRTPMKLKKLLFKFQNSMYQGQNLYQGLNSLLQSIKIDI